jgi:Fis family transcriptional regulator, factor for inversion stimulation protein
MNLDADTRQSNPELISNGGAQSMALPLSAHVRIAVERYFSQLNGHPACGLHCMVIGEVEKPLIQTVLDHSGHNQTKAARILGMSRSTLRNKMERYGLV